MPPKILNNIELTAKLEALEAKKPKLKDLPLMELRKALNNEPTDPTTSILPNSISNALLAHDSTFEVFEYNCTTALTVSEAYTLVPGMTHVVTEPGNFFVICTLDYETGGGAFAFGEIALNSDEGPAFNFHNTDGRRAMPLIKWFPKLARNTTINAKAKRSGGAATVYSGHSRMIVIRLGG